MEKPNQNYINDLSLGDIAFKQKLISILKDEYPRERAIYFKNINSKDYKLAAENVHKLKHKISILGLEKSYEIAMAFENNLLEGKSELKKEFETVLNTVTNYLDHL